MRQRIIRLEERIQLYSGAIQPTTFMLENGGTIITGMDPLDYLVQNGSQTAFGRIVSYLYPMDVTDPLSLAIYEAINDEIRTGAIRALLMEGL